MRINNRRKQAGFVLAVSMIFLIIMTMLAVTAIKKATMDEKVSGNLRAQNLAFDAAEKALRFCESNIELAAGDTEMCKMKLGATVLVIPPTRPYRDDDVNANFPIEWSNMDNWNERGPNNAVRLNGINAVPNVAMQPQCMIERWEMPSNRGEYPGEQFYPYVITARGVGSTATAVVWLQEVLRCGNY